MVYAIDLTDPKVNPVAPFGSFASLLNLIVPLLISFGALLFLVSLLYAAYTFMTSGGNAENIKKAQKIATYSIMGLILLIVSFVVVKLIGVIFNVSDQIPL